MDVRYEGALIGRHVVLFRSVLAAVLWGFNTLMMGMARFHHTIPIRALSCEQGMGHPAHGYSVPVRRGCQ